MSAPLYFLPGVHREQLVMGDRLSPALLEGRGLAPIFGDIQDLAREVSFIDIAGSGPGGVSGTILVPLAPRATPPARLGYYPAMQDWHPQGGYWLGFDRESPVRPEELFRRRIVGGYRMQMGDGNYWRVPIVRRPDGTSELPTSYGWDDCGVFFTRVRRSHAPLWEEAAELVEWFSNGTLFEAAQANMARVVEWCVRLLAVNYRFDRVLQTHLKVVGTDDWASVLAYAIDWFEFEESKTQSNAPARG